MGVRYQNKLKQVYVTQTAIVMHTTKNVSNVVGALNPKREREKKLST